MAINSSGAVSLIGTTSGQSIEYELGGSGSTALGLLCTGPRALSHVASGAVTMPGCFYSKHAVPGTPTVGTPTASTYCSVSVPFTAPGCVGASSITGYTVTSCPGAHIGTGSSSPITVGSLSGSTSYTFKVKATNSYGTGPCSSASSSVTTPSAGGSQSYTTPGTYTWIAPSGVTSVSVVTVGAPYLNFSGALSYKNNISVTAGCSYTVRVIAGGTNSQTYFKNTCTVYAGYGASRVGDGGGNGALSSYGGAGAGGYSGNGGAGGSSGCRGCNGSGGGGGGGGAGKRCYSCCCYPYISGSGGGGGVGLFGQGSSGAYGAGGNTTGTVGVGGGGGSGGNSGTSGANGIYGSGGNGGNYGGSKGLGANIGPCGTHAGGAVRIVWPGSSRTFPSTCVGSP